VALAMARTGIASNLLKLGRTFHSRLKAPLTPNKESTLQISAQSDLAKLVRMARLLLIDESTMLDKFQLEALDRSLRDLMDRHDQPFGGKILVLAGDFRQCLPVVPGASRAGTVSHCINRSHLWQHFKLFQLTENMRVRASGDPALEAFDDWTLSIGNGVQLNGSVPIPDDMVLEIVPNTKTETKNEENSMKKFCQEIFPDLKSNINKQGWLEGRTILAPTNKEVDAINDMVQDWLSDAGIKLSSADTVENLNTLSPKGFAKHTLNLKPGMPLVILRNINPRQGLCNGTRVVFEKCIDNKLLQCKIVETGRIVLIPRITFIPKANEYPFEWQRRQFPVRPAFAMTINKSQGQTLKHAGIWLRGQVFTHGQLYVACSRVSSPENLKFALMREANSQQFTAVNIVYREVLLSNQTDQEQ
jgi:ATP-dependent exoDNAse (exonuclease V) alpha subunit